MTEYFMTCPSCDGSGVWYDQGDTYQCQECKGSKVVDVIFFAEPDDNTKKYAEYAYMLFEGEDHFVDKMLKEMQEDGYIDENQEWIYNDDD